MEPTKPLPLWIVLTAAFAILFGGLGFVMSGYGAWRSGLGNALGLETMSPEAQKKLLSELRGIVQDPSLLEEAKLPATLGRLSPDFGREWRELAGNPQLAPQLAGTVQGIRNHLQGRNGERWLLFFDSGQAQETLDDILYAGRVFGLIALLEFGLSVTLLAAGIAIFLRRGWGLYAMSAALILAPLLSALGMWLLAGPVLRSTYTLLSLSGLAIKAPVEQWQSLASTAIWGTGLAFTLMHILIVVPLLSAKTKRHFDSEDFR